MVTHPCPVCPFDEWDHYVKTTCPEKHGLVWIYRDCHPLDAYATRMTKRTPDDLANLQTTFGRGARGKGNIYTITYVCHRSGQKRVNKTRLHGGQTAKPRAVQKDSKHIACKAKLRVIYSWEDLENVRLETTLGEHGHNHVPGSIDDVQYLSLSKSAKSMLRGELEKGYSQRKVRLAMRKEFRANPEMYTPRDTYVNSKEVYNIYRGVQERAYRKHRDEAISTRLWLENLRAEEGFSVFFSDNFQETFSFGFVSPWQRSLLRSTSAFCLDATHKTTAIGGDLLYTIVIRHSDTGTGCPVAYLFTKDQSAGVLCNWLLFVKGCGLVVPEKVTIDCSSVEVLALRNAFPDTPIQWCVFHVIRAWWDRIRQDVNSYSVQESKVVRQQVLSAMKDIMWARDPAEMGTKLNAFLCNYAHFTIFIQYFERTWVANGRLQFWTICNQPQLLENMETNNYVESWHNQLKTNFLERHPNRRMDRLVYILVRDVEPVYRDNIERVLLGLGRMGPVRYEERRRFAKAEEFPPEFLAEMISTDEPRGVTSSLHVQSFSLQDVAYTVSLENNELVRCDCPSFGKMGVQVCKHMFLCARFHSHMVIRRREPLPIAPTTEDLPDQDEFPGDHDAPASLPQTTGPTPVPGPASPPQPSGPTPVPWVVDVPGQLRQASEAIKTATGACRSTDSPDLQEHGLREFEFDL